MENVLVSSALYIVISVTILELILGVLFFIEYRKAKDPLTFCVFLIGVALFADAFLLLVGSMFGHISEGASIMRYFAHGLLTPLLLPVSGYSVMMKRKTERIIWTCTLILMVIGSFATFMTVLEPVVVGDVYRHAQGASTPGWVVMIMFIMSAGMIIPLFVSGIISLTRKRSGYLLLAGVSMLIFAMAAPLTGLMDLLFIFSMLGEVFMSFFFYLFIKKEYSYGT